MSPDRASPAGGTRARQYAAHVSGEDEVLRELASVGYGVATLANLRTSGTEYREAIPVLVSALAAVEDRKTKEEVVRALSVPWAKPTATHALIEQFRGVEDPTGLGIRWTIGNALEVVWDDLFFDDLVRLARAEEYGRAREMVVLGLAQSKRPEAGSVLVALLEDPVVSGHAAKAIRRFRLPAARAGLEKLLQDQRAWVRNDARRALAEIDAEL